MKYNYVIVNGWIMFVQLQRRVLTSVIACVTWGHDTVAVTTTDGSTAKTVKTNLHCVVAVEIVIIMKFLDERIINVIVLLNDISEQT